MVHLPIYMALLLAGTDSRESIRFRHAAEQTDPLGCGKAVLQTVLENLMPYPEPTQESKTGSEVLPGPGSLPGKKPAPLFWREAGMAGNSKSRTGKGNQADVPDPVARLLNTIPDNAELSAFTIRTILSRAGMNAVVLRLSKDGLEEAIRQFTSVILHFNKPSGHYVQARTVGGWGAIISDPAEGTVWISSRQLEQRWSGVAICADLSDADWVPLLSADPTGSNLRARQDSAGSDAEGRITLIHRLLHPGMKGSVP